jgi:hypothetical protein
MRLRLPKSRQESKLAAAEITVDKADRTRARRQEEETARQRLHNSSLRFLC